VFKLEIKFTRKGDGGSNPSLSANKLIAGIPNSKYLSPKLFPRGEFLGDLEEETTQTSPTGASIDCWSSAVALAPKLPKRSGFRPEAGRAQL
jgi:hypothetical protein